MPRSSRRRNDERGAVRSWPWGNRSSRPNRAGDVSAMVVEAPCRFVVLPDFFADDIVIDATQIPVAKAELPSENFLLHLLPDGQAIVMTVANSREQDAQVELAGQDGGADDPPQRDPVRQAGKVWVAVLEAPDIWHHRDVATAESGKVLPLDWKAPFRGAVARRLAADRQADRQLGDDRRAAERRVHQVRLVRRARHACRPNRNRWTTVLGRVPVPVLAGPLRPGLSPAAGQEGRSPSKARR